MTNAEDPLLLDIQLCFALYSASLQMTKLYKPLLNEISLTYPQYVTMLSLWETDGVTVGALGKRLFLDSGTLTPLLKRLEAASLVTRTRNAKDERQVMIRLTLKGRALKQKAACIPQQVGARGGLSISEFLTLRKTLKKLRAALAA
ncbi:MarR family winged helix-turn-helix transcriptional regulator [Hyphomonas sp.]|uniref:MarR family winged helix-turn-helix transcriptional regulator n=1 Tax=Hyphomonas sp. TaxID=87 RepID=UPI0034A001A7